RPRIRELITVTAAIHQPHDYDSERDLRAVPPPDGVPEEGAPAAQREVHAEQAARTDGAVKVHLGGSDGIAVWVPPRNMWRNSALTALHQGNFQLWADATLTEEDAVAWEDYDPTLQEIEEFFVRLNTATGDEPG